MHQLTFSAVLFNWHRQKSKGIIRGGSYGVYIRAANVIAGNIDAAGQVGSGANEEASGGGGGAILISYGSEGYLSGTYNYAGSGAGTTEYGKAGVGGSGGIITYNYNSSPPITP